VRSTPGRPSRPPRSKSYAPVQDCLSCASHTHPSHTRERAHYTRPRADSAPLPPVKPTCHPRPKSHAPIQGCITHTDSLELLLFTHTDSHSHRQPRAASVHSHRQPLTQTATHTDSLELLLFTHLRTGPPAIQGWKDSSCGQQLLQRGVCNNTLCSISSRHTEAGL